MTATRAELEQFKESLRAHAKANNLEVILESLKMFYERFKHILTEEDANDIKKIVEEMSVMKKGISQPTTHEYLLFFIVMIFVIWVFGEMPSEEFICRFINNLIFYFFVKTFSIFRVQVV